MTPGALTEQRVAPLQISKGSCCLWLSLEAERQVQDSQRRKAKDHCNLSPRGHVSQQAPSRLPTANHVFLGSWMVHICHQFTSVTAWDQLPWGNAQPTGTALAVHPGAWAAWTCEEHAALRCGSPRVVHPLQVLPAHECFVSSAPPPPKHSWASAPKLVGIFTLSCQGRNQTLKRDLQTGGQPKQWKGGGTAPERAGATEQNPAVKLRQNIWGATTDFENKHELEQGIIWHWTDPTLPTTAPETFLDMFCLLLFLKFVLVFKFLLLLFFPSFFPFLCFFPSYCPNMLL